MNGTTWHQLSPGWGQMAPKHEQIPARVAPTGTKTMTTDDKRATPTNEKDNDFNKLSFRGDNCGYCGTVRTPPPLQRCLG